MSSNEDRRGIERLRETLETVTTDIELRRRSPTHAQHVWRPRLAAGFAVLLLALLIGYFAIGPSRPPRTAEVEVLMLKIRGRDVGARIVDDTTPATIIVMPRSPDIVSSASVGVIAGGVR